MVFVLGIERSSTTWVSNILEMHPGTEVYMEPLSGNISRFKGWPDRFVRITDRPAKADYFRKEFIRLKRRKKFLFSTISESRRAWALDLEIARRIWKFSDRARDFFELNFHRLGSSGFPAKGSKPLCVIKELRLNYNAALIREIDPGAKVVVVLRNFASNITSIRRHIEQGDLKELARLLGQRYGSPVSIENLFDYWANSYNTLLGDLDEEGMDYLLLTQDEFLLSGKESANRLFDFIGLNPVPAVYSYIAGSDQSGSGKHSTKRDHATLLEKNRQAGRELQPMLERHIERLAWHPRLKKYLMESSAG